MHWFWMNSLLAALIVGIWTGVPLWPVLTHPGIDPEPLVPATLHQACISGSAGPHAAEAHSSRHASESRLPVGAHI